MKKIRRPGSAPLRALSLVALLCLPAAVPAGAAGPLENGDCNGDGARDLSDAVYLLGWLFIGGPAPAPAACPEGAPERANGDSNGDGALDLSDAVHILSWLFTGGEEPAALGCPAGGAVRFIALGSTGKGNQGQLEVAEAIRRKCAESGCDFVQLLGNNIYDSGVTSVDDPAWEEKFEAPYREIDLPFYAILGNHDYGGEGAGNEFGKEQHEIDYTARSSKWRMPAHYYRHALEGVEFFALDTNAQLWSRDAQQKVDVRSWISSSTAAWKIAFGHHHYLSNGPHGNAGEYDGTPSFIFTAGKTVKEFMDGVICGKVDLYLSAHDHSLQWLEPTCQGTELLLSGAGASTTGLGGSNPVHFQAAELGFVYVVIEGKTLTAEVIDSTGALRFSRVIRKP